MELQVLPTGPGRFKSKKAVKEASPDTVRCIGTSTFDRPCNTTLDQLPDGSYTFAGPDTYTDRKYYGQILVKDGKVTIK